MTSADESERGFSLIEVVLCVALLAAGSLAALGVLPGLVRSSQAGLLRNAAAEVGRNAIERVRAAVAYYPADAGAGDVANASDHRWAFDPGGTSTYVAAVRVHRSFCGSARPITDVPMSVSMSYDRPTDTIRVSVDYAANPCDGSVRSTIAMSAAVARIAVVAANATRHPDQRARATVVLAQTVFLMAALALFASTAVAGIAAYARTQSAAVAKSHLAPGVEAALAIYEHDVRARIASELSVASQSAYSSAPVVVPALNGGDAWAEESGILPADGVSAIRVAYDIVPTTAAAPACVPQPGATNGGVDIAENAQCSGFIQESRLSLAIATSAGPLGADGAVTPLAANRFTVTLRLFAQPPYTMIAGVKDSADPATLHEGDSGGWAGANNAATAGDTTIHVTYRCSGDAACATSVPPSLDVTRSLPWSNGNGRANAP